MLKNKHFTYNPETGDLVRRSNDQIVYAKRLGYLVFRLNYKQYYAHRYIWWMMTGEWPDVVDHINEVKDDNRWCNLRSVTRQKNLEFACLNRRIRQEPDYLLKMLKS